MFHWSITKTKQDRNLIRRGMYVSMSVFQTFESHKKEQEHLPKPKPWFYFLRCVVCERIFFAQSRPTWVRWEEMFSSPKKGRHLFPFSQLLSHNAFS